MTIEELTIILAKAPADIVKDLQTTSFSDLPSWGDLEPQYDPMQHNIQDPALYPAKLDSAGKDDFKRTSLGLQKLAVNRLAQSMFSTPTKRVYNYDRDSESQAHAIQVIEEVYRTRNYIDSSNIERAKKLNASCQVVTVWAVMEKPTRVEMEDSKFKLFHNIYSEMDGYSIYPITDPSGALLVVSIGYKDSSDVEHLAVYTNTEPAQYLLFDNVDDWVLNTERSNNNLSVFPVVYANIKEPVWGGESGTNLVEQLEEMESYQGLYIKRNALPTFTLDYGELPAGKKKAAATESSSDARRIIKLGKGGNMQDVTWDGAGEAISNRYERIRNAFFEQIQVPDTSFANMIKSNTSAENKELIFADAKAKAKDLGGEWEKLFYDELEIVIAFCKIIFPNIAKDLEEISVRSIIMPYSIKTKKENAEYIATGGSGMSLETKVRVLGEVDDVEAEILAIEEEKAADNQGGGF